MRSINVRYLLTYLLTYLLCACEQMNNMMCVVLLIQWQYIISSEAASLLLALKFVWAQIYIF